MFAFLTTISEEDLRYVVKKLSSNVETESPLSPRSQEILRSVRFTSHEMKQAGIVAAMKIAARSK
ncbi:hypothetical protein [Massilia scottii]|uniref:hypothetical protein n=1 Tax=Massilia scottii TaxID=3057166 RepID=UPI002796C4A0|nr:hypothetical protein [Massilia sp. CCM 9029]MDQ1830035.1 hypothetical protein [Massilia sp. CCM 9029]